MGRNLVDSFNEALRKQRIEKNIWASKRNWRREDPTNEGLMYLYRGPDIISEIKKGRSRCLGHVERMPEEMTVKEGFKNIAEGKKIRWKAKERHFDDVENDLNKMNV
jgi:hypothetical protein